MFDGRSCHPEHNAIEKIIARLREVLFPNYFEPSHRDSIMSSMDRLHDLLAGQIHRAHYQQCIEKDSTPESRAFAVSKANEFVERLPLIQEILYEDVLETYQGDPSATGYDEIILTYPGLVALTVYRAANVLHTLDVPLLPRMMTEFAHQMTGIDLHPGATIGAGIMIDHGTGIVVGETATVGNHVKMYQGVTLGAFNFPRDESGSMIRSAKRHPTVEDHVILYANATVLGGDTVVGHHSVVGSSAWVTESLPPYSKVIYRSDSVIRTQTV